MVQGRENMEVAAIMGFHVWIYIAQPEKSVLVLCHERFASFLKTTFLFTCGVLHRGDATNLVNNIAYLLFVLLEQIHDAEHHLDLKNCEQHFVFLELG
jgi:hypothetical protein